jgi:hypothetical protein
MGAWCRLRITESRMSEKNMIRFVFRDRKAAFVSAEPWSTASPGQP